MIHRRIEKELGLIRQEFPVIAILGPRQSGKTTSARSVFPDYEYVSLEDIDIRQFAQEDPRGFLRTHPKRVILDEIQRVPKLFSYLQTHVDTLQENGSVIITGSHNFLLIEQISQSLAGRVGIVKLLPFSYGEIQVESSVDALLHTGFYPRIYDQGIRPWTFYNNYISTYVEKDLRQIKHIMDLDRFMLFLRLLAGRTGQELRVSSLSEECGVSHNTITSWLSVLEACFIIFRVKPYHKNYSKRLVKNHKIYFVDTGLACNLLGIRKEEELSYHFLRGALFETFVIGEFYKEALHTGGSFDLYYWRDNHQREIDLIIERGQKVVALEIKRSETVHSKFFDSLKYWSTLSGHPIEDTCLIYGGDSSYRRSGTHVVSSKAIYEQIVSALV